MQHAIDLIKSLEATNSRNEKEAILTAAIQTYQDIKDIFLSALNPYINYYIIQVPAKGKGTGLDINKFYQAINDLSQRNITGNDARDLVKSLSEEATADEWHYIYKRIILKDLKCGVTEKTINKVYKTVFGEELIETFSCQLAHDCADHPSKMVGPKIIQSKLDGVRIIAIVVNKQCTLYSRTGRIITNFPQISEAIEALNIEGDYVFDGEIMSASFQDLMKQLNRKDDINTDDSVFYVFDSLPLEDFRKGRYDKTQITRDQLLKQIISESKSPLLNTLHSHYIDLSTEEGRTAFGHINKEAIRLGYEGIMIKDPNAPYECKRSSSWLKMKPVIDVTVEIKDFEEGTGKYEGMLGAFQCEGVDDGKLFSVSVGGGYTDEQRKLFWDARKDMIGQLIEVRADAVTQNQDGTYSLRFPRFQRFRGFNSGEKI